MTKINRRDSLKMMAAASLAASAGFACTPQEAERAHEHAARASGATYAEAPGFFTDHEFQAVRLLADTIIPADERSGGASEANVPEFIDFMMTDRPELALPMRGGLAWLDGQCRKQFDRAFVDCDEAQRAAVLDALAWPADAAPELSHGVAFFNLFRDLTATGFWTSAIGIEDLQYQGNVPNPTWDGCTDEACRKLGVSYAAWDGAYRKDDKPPFAV